MRIGIIGSGAAGLVTAWLLEEHHEVLLFEKNDRFGGHAQTVYVNQRDTQIPIEIGFEFFNERMYPHFCRLLAALNVATRTFDFTYTFYQANKQLLVLPPIQKNKIFWHSFSPRNIYSLIQLKKVIAKSHELMMNKNGLVTLEEFAKQQGISSHFMSQFFLPLFCAGWGVSAEEFSTFSAYNVLAYIVKNKPIGLQPSIWLEIINGMSSYISTLINSLTRTHLKKSTTITSLSYANDKYTIATHTDELRTVDHLIVATDPHSAPSLLQLIDYDKTRYNAISSIEFIPTTIAVHQDPRFMAPRKQDWSVANVNYNGTYSTLTINKQWKSSNLFRSWLLPGFPEPVHIQATQDYFHPKPNLNYFKAQQVIASTQGTNNLWIAGLYTNDIDSHESAVVSAVTIAKKLAPQSKRLQSLTN